MEQASKSRIVKFKYTNYRGETSIRTAVIHGVYWGSTDWHPEPGYLMNAFDVEKKDNRIFALKDCDFTTVT